MGDESLNPACSTDAMTELSGAKSGLFIGLLHVLMHCDQSNQIIVAAMVRVQKNPFKKNPTHWIFGGLLGLGFIGFRTFYLNKQLGILLVDLAHQQSFV